MKSDEFKELLKKCFGKQKDDRYHAIAMLAIYAIFIFIVVLVIRMGGSTSSSSNLTGNSPTQTPVINVDKNEDIETENNETPTNDINYSYSYTISYNGVSEVYLGKKIDDKERFTLVKDGITTNYAILSENFLIMENDTYHITESPSRFFKYCDVEKLLLIVENEISIESGNTVKYNVSNQLLSKSYKDNLTLDNQLDNMIQLTKSDNTLKSIDIDFSNYISSIDNTNSTLTIHMEFVDIGTTEDFEIKIN